MVHTFSRWWGFKPWRVKVGTNVVEAPGSTRRLEEEAKSLGYYQDAHRVWPVNLDVISWLGAFHVRSEVYERAIPYFELAAAIQPQEVKWALMTASCYRRTGAYPQAFKR